MKISIVIPSFNTDRFISRAITSIRDQQYEDYEVIVIDGGSTDETLRILEHWAWELKGKLKWFSEPDKGEPDAINKGMRLATGDIVAYLDADDGYLGGCFETVAKYFAEHDVMWVYGKCKVIDEHDNETRQLVTRFKELFQPHYSYRSLLMFDYIAQPSVFWWRDVVQEIGYMDIEKRLAFDYDYWLRIGQKYQAGYINKYIAVWRSHESSETAKALSKDMREGLDISIKYSRNAKLLRLPQYGIYWLALLGYKAMGAL